MGEARELEIRLKYKKAGVLRCCETPAFSKILLQSVSQSCLCEGWQTEKLRESQRLRKSFQIRTDRAGFSSMIGFGNGAQRMERDRQLYGKY